MQTTPQERDVLEDARHYLDRVTSVLGETARELQVEAEELASEASWESLFGELRGMLSGGKLVRPTFVYWGWRAAGGEPDGTEALVRAGVAIELTHACALVHDDIMDASETRRGRPASHVRFAGEKGHLTAAESAHYGLSAALLLGDLALVTADRMFIRGIADDPNVGHDRWLKAFDIFTTMRIEVTEGQYLDLVESTHDMTRPSTALAIASMKTALYTVERPLLVGAALAGSAPALDQALSGYGREVGVAFQLRDDLLGAFGDPEVTGKPVGGDFREAKSTYLLATSIAEGNTEQARALRALVGNRVIEADEIETIQMLLRDTGGEARCIREIDERLSAGLAFLDAGIPSDARSALRSLAEQMAFRSR